MDGDIGEEAEEVGHVLHWICLAVKIIWVRIRAGHYSTARYNK